MNSLSPNIASLPIAHILPDILQRLSVHNTLVIQAPPGAGKTTAVPLALRDNNNGKKAGKIIVLEPRRLAARAAARRMAQLLGEAVGETVGYRVRLDHKVSDRTCIEVVTEGVLIRMLQQDPEMVGIDTIIFDEFHERSLEADLGLALCLEVQQALRDDLKLIVMSATLHGEKVARLMNDAPIVTSKGRSFSVTEKYLDHPVRGHIEPAVTSAITEALKKDQGNILTFLPGAKEIEKCSRLLQQQNLGPEIIIAPLYGMMAPAAQDKAINPAPAGKRKIVLATDIAETSLTIEGIRIVIDAGLDRSPRYDVRSGMTRLETRPLSKASAEQRAGRAGRLEPGICYRLWTEAAQRGLVAHSSPEITRADLVPLMIELFHWGISDPDKLKWLDSPDQASVSKATALLHGLGAVDVAGRITQHGKKITRLAMHPRLAHMVLTAQKQGRGECALRTAALLTERDILRDRSANINLRLDALNYYLNGKQDIALKMGADLGALKQIKKQLGNWRRHLKIPRDEDVNPNHTGRCLALAFPDRVAMKRQTIKQKTEKETKRTKHKAVPQGRGPARYILSGGRGAVLDPEDELSTEKFLAVCHLDRGDRDARIFLAAPLYESDIEDIFTDHIKEIEQIEWDDRTTQVLALKKRMLGRLILKQERLNRPDKAAIVRALCQGITKMGLSVLPWDKHSMSLRERVLLCQKYYPEENWPDFSEEHLLKTVDQWLGPFLTNIVRQEQLTSLDLRNILHSPLSWQQSQRLDQLAPTHVQVPSGSNIAIDYSTDPPILAARLQEMFGLQQTPEVLEGRLKLLIHLLSPAGRPIQITQDLEHFWRNSYQQVKKEMKGRYPKHHWPDDPNAATATRRLKPKKLS